MYLPEYVIGLYKWPKPGIGRMPSSNGAASESTTFKRNKLVISTLQNLAIVAITSCQQYSTITMCNPNADIDIDCIPQLQPIHHSQIPSSSSQHLFLKYQSKASYSLNLCYSQFTSKQQHSHQTLNRKSVRVKVLIRTFEH